MHVLRVEDLKAANGRRNGMGAKPNVYKRSLEARETTDHFLRLAAGLEEEPARLTRWQRIRQWWRK